ncbi:MAG TPA: Na-translocating system protein MpsC family protein [Solirubrobacteraceae bacterium]|jgi:hypothetical protein
MAEAELTDEKFEVRANEDTAPNPSCLLEHTFTPAERNLQAMGEHQRLRDIRMLFQYAETSRFTEPIERITGRRVRGFISGIDTNSDIASEMFILDPIPGPAGSGTASAVKSPGLVRHI